MKASFMLVLALAVAALAAGAAPGNASAAGSLLKLGCDKQSSAREFERWNDSRYYKSFPNGGFERGGDGWKLSNGAKVVAGNEPFGLAGGGDYSLVLPAGAAATSSAVCVKILDSGARFMTLETGASSGALKVELQYKGLLGLWSTVKLGTLSGSGEWEPSPIYDFHLENVLGSLLSLNVTTTEVKLKLTATGTSARFQVDATLVDPWLEGF